MIHAGDRLENPLTGETMIFHRTSRETGVSAQAPAGPVTTEVRAYVGL